MRVIAASSLPTLVRLGATAVLHVLCKKLLAGNEIRSKRPSLSLGCHCHVSVGFYGVAFKG